MENKNIPPWIVVIILTMVTLLGVVIGNIFASQLMPLEQASQHSTIISPTDTATQKTQVVTAPMNTAELEKYEPYKDCKNSESLVTYHDKKADTWMKINSLLDLQNTDSEEGITQIEAYLNGAASPKAYQDILAWENPFHYACGGTTQQFIKDLPGITYPNTEKSRAMIVYTTQSIHGNVTVTVFAKRGNDIIKLDKFLADESIYKSSRDACGTEDEKCYKEKLLTDTTLQHVAEAEAKALISQFTIK